MSATFINATSQLINVTDNGGVNPTIFLITGTTDGTINPPGMTFNITYTGSGSVSPLSGSMSNIGGNNFQSPPINYTPPPGFIGTETGFFTLSSIDPTLTSNTANLTFNVTCLHSSTQILTEEGYQKISTLKEGEFVLTSSGKKSKITRIVHSKIRDNDNKMMLSIPKDGIFPGYPSEEVLLSYGHTVLLEPEKGNEEGKWMMAINLPKYFPSVTYPDIKEPFVLYNLHLESFFEDNLVVNNGFVVESLGDGKTIWKEDGDYRYKDPALK